MPFGDLPDGDPTACGPNGVRHENCENGGILWKFATIDILAAANGNSFTAEAFEGSAVPGDFLRIQPIDGIIRPYYLLFLRGAAAGGDPLDAGFGVQRKNRKAKQPTLDGSFRTDTVCGAAVNLAFEDGIGMQVNPGNWQCIPAATNDSPVDVALVNNSGGNLIDICVGMGYRYWGDGYKMGCEVPNQ